MDTLGFARLSAFVLGGLVWGVVTGKYIRPFRRSQMVYWIGYAMYAIVVDWMTQP